jgi:hypothetical protein
VKSTAIAFFPIQIPGREGRGVHRPFLAVMQVNVLVGAVDLGLVEQNVLVGCFIVVFRSTRETGQHQYHSQLEIYPFFFFAEKWYRRKSPKV